ncbi:MAG: class I SAM-dependent methyltransferase [Gammaproteobacteria bacterium]|nr:class I SAM-dependent methyltransferase [Gammaproteobacteria bacterium]
MQEMKCTVCGGTNNRQLDFLPSYGKYNLMECNECGLKYIVSENFETLDDDSYWDEVNKKIYSMPNVLNEFKKKQNKYLKRMIKLSPPNKRLLDVGCGNGIFLNNAKLNGFEAAGIEPSRIAVDLCKQQYGFSPTLGYLELDSDLEKNFGALSAWDVIEHVADPKDFLKICHAHLVKGGVFILETPDESSWIRGLINIIDSVKKMLKIGAASNIYYPSHRYYFTHKAMKSVLKNAGFTNIKIYKEHTIYSKAIAKNRLYRKFTNFQMLKYYVVFFLLRAPFLWNKQVVICVKK